MTRLSPFPIASSTNCSRCYLSSSPGVVQYFLKSLNMYSFALLTLLALLCNVQAQTSSSIYVEPTVPTGTPIPGDYSGALRPQLHYSPPIDFMVSTNQCTWLPVA